MSETYSEYAVKGKGGLLSVFGVKTEYETIYLDGTLEIAAIYNKSRRKRKFICEMKEVMGYHLGRKEDAARLGMITKDFSSGKSDAVCCVMKVSTGKGIHVICFEPGEDLEKILRRRYPQLKA